MMLSDTKVAVAKAYRCSRGSETARKKKKKPKVKRTLRPFMTLKAQRIKC